MLAAIRAVRYWEALHPTSAGGAYVNFMMDEGASRLITGTSRLAWRYGSQAVSVPGLSEPP